MRRRAARVDDALGNALVVEVRDLLAQDEVFEQRRTAQPGLERVLVVGDRHALIGGQRAARSNRRARDRAGRSSGSRRSVGPPLPTLSEPFISLTVLAPTIGSRPTATVALPAARPPPPDRTRPVCSLLNGIALASSCAPAIFAINTSADCVDDAGSAGPPPVARLLRFAEDDDFFTEGRARLALGIWCARLASCGRIDAKASTGCKNATESVPSLKSTVASRSHVNSRRSVASHRSQVNKSVASEFQVSRGRQSSSSDYQLATDL